MPEPGIPVKRREESVSRQGAKMAKKQRVSPSIPCVFANFASWRETDLFSAPGRPKIVFPGPEVARYNGFEYISQTFPRGLS